MKAAMTRVEEGGSHDEWLLSSTTVTELLLDGNQFVEAASHAALVHSFLENQSICTAFAERNRNRACDGVTVEVKQGCALDGTPPPATIVLSHGKVTLHGHEPRLRPNSTDKAPKEGTKSATGVLPISSSLFSQ